MLSGKTSYHSKGTQKKEQIYLLPATSISRIATAILGSINKVVIPLISSDAEDELMPMLERRTPTPACSRIWGV